MRNQALQITQTTNVEKFAKSCQSFLPLISAYITFSECFGGCGGNTLFWLKKNHDLLWKYLLWPVFSGVSLYAVCLWNQCLWIICPTESISRVYRLLKLEKNYQKKELPCCGSTVSSKCPCRWSWWWRWGLLSISLSSEVKSFSSLLSSRNWNFPLTSGNSVTSSSPYRLMKV